MQFFSANFSSNGFLYFKAFTSVKLLRNDLDKPLAFSPFPQSFTVLKKVNKKCRRGEFGLARKGTFQLFLLAKYLFIYYYNLSVLFWYGFEFVDISFLLLYAAK